MRVSVVIPTYRRPELLMRCLAAVNQQEGLAEPPEIIVADDGNDEATRDAVQQFPGVRYLAVQGRHGPAAARNFGWRAASGEIIAFTDDDCIPDRLWLAEGLAALNDRDVIAVTGRTIVPLPDEPTDHARNTAGLEQSEFLTANCFCRKGVLEEVGGFDESFRLAWREDSDLHFRLLDTGGKIVRAASAIVVHPVRRARWGSSLQEQCKAAYDALLFRKHPQHFRQRIAPQCPWTYYVIAGCALAAIALALSGNFGPALASAGVWLLLTLQLAARRLRNTVWSPAHVTEMVVTSAAIPFLSIFWRVYGGLKFRVLFW